MRMVLNSPGHSRRNSAMEAPYPGLRVTVVCLESQTHMWEEQKPSCFLWGGAERSTQSLGRSLKSTAQAGGGFPL